MDPLKQKFFEVSQASAQEIKAILKEHGETQIDTVTVSQAYGGMRGIECMIWETSELDANEGIRFRGYSIPELQEKLPKGKGTQPLPEGLFWLMLVNEIPTEEQVNWLTEEWRRRGQVDPAVFKVLDSLPLDTHPMTQFTIGIMAMQRDSVFAHKYEEGLSKNAYWDVMYEDTMNLIAKLPRLASYIYRRTYFNNQQIEPDPHLDWAANFGHMAGFDSSDFQNLMRLYMTIHADHEGGNASAHTTHLVGSTLSDAYLCLAAGINALAGPLHGLANQEVIKWIHEMTDKLNTQDPTEEQIIQYVKDTMAAGQVIPGYGHAVLRKPDPRFIAQQEFAKHYCPDSSLVNIVRKIFKVVPPILQETGKIKNPWPNVDAHSGALLVHYGMDQYNYYTVLFGVSRALGVLAQLCWSRALGFPLERPKSLSTVAVKQKLGIS